jgi:hypothetical protein
MSANTRRWTLLQSQFAGCHDLSDIAYVWMYGGKALDPRRSGGDVDVLVVREHECEPTRRAMGLPNGEEAHLNVVGPSAFAAHNVACNGGFYFSGKLLAPRELVWGDREAADVVLGVAHRHMSPWARAVAPGTDQCDTAAADVARMYLLKLAINASYANYLAKWFTHPAFEDHWAHLVRIYAQASDVQTESVRFSDSDYGAIPASLLIEFLTASWWRSNLVIRESREPYLDMYFAEQQRLHASLVVETWGRTRQALERVSQGDSDSPTEAFRALSHIRS